jgi:hypothetical protein
MRIKRTYSSVAVAFRLRESFFIRNLVSKILSPFFDRFSPLCYTSEVVAEKFEDYSGQEVELTDERRAHILCYHPDMASFLDRMPKVLRAPDVLRQSTDDQNVLIYYKYFAEIFGGKYLAVVVKTNNRRFVLTAYLTRRIQTGKST